MAVLAAGAVWAFISGRYCAYPGTDFRGYYASAQITWRSGFSAVYNPEMQRDTQAELPIRCPDGSMAAPRMMVMVPYLPVFINLFLPLPWMDFSLELYHLDTDYYCGNDFLSEAFFERPGYASKLAAAIPVADMPAIPG